MEKIATLNIWSSGISNVPLGDRSSRYTFFELDTKNISSLRKVLDTFRDNLGSVYVHELIGGFHFYNLEKISKERYWKIIRGIKLMNPECPLTVLRLIPNKWEGEAKFWKKGIILGRDSPELSELKTCIESQNIAPLKNKYEIVHYPFEECPECRRSDSIRFDFNRKYFVCLRCGIQSVGRMKRRCYSTSSKFGSVL